MNNPELRAVLTEALSRSYYRIVGSSSDCRVDPGEILADAVLSLPGVAVIQLPEPSYVDEPEAGMKGVGFNGGPQDTHLSERGVYVHDGLVYDQWDGVTPADALKVAGWWAAAAVVAAGEEHHG
ncbi:gp74 [Mycobacterium phage Fruitloop]|uniref:Uncharacterized protein n=1 Tax=Mycobacterium phage Fruitloop TaxID=2914018 RepID=B5U4S3_9CAUD|nr:gp74 [Mycobacterium phage Fruitloop]ACI12385.1 hypothetical protein FRUITLOOP_74 [Mycobacterium phage Fruitloop]